MEGLEVRKSGIIRPINPIKPFSFPASRLSSSFVFTTWLLYEKSLAFVKQWILNLQLSLKRLMEEFSVKAQGDGVDLKAAGFPEV